VRARLLSNHAGARIHVVTPAVHVGPDVLRRRDDGFVLFCGTLEPRKGLGRVAEALLRTSRDVPLVVVGKAGWGVLPGRAALDSLAALGRLDLRGYVTEAALARLRARAAVAVVPSLDEGFGLPLLEAMATGCPVVASDIAVFREVADDAVRYAEPEDIRAWALQLEALLADADARFLLGAKGRARARLFDHARQTRALAIAIAAATAGSRSVHWNVDT
jgi:alpha-1,3-rhamnosyl/mannosyltransferase